MKSSENFYYSGARRPAEESRLHRCSRNVSSCLLKSLQLLLIVGGAGLLISATVTTEWMREEASTKRVG